MQAPRLGPTLLIVLTLWALAMIVPDIYRLGEPLGSFGFDPDNNGLVIDVRGPFAEEAESPAYAAGMRAGDRLDLSQMRCIPVSTLRCATALATLGGLQLVSSHRRGEIALAASAGKPPRLIELTAKPIPHSWSMLAVLGLDQLAAIAVILAAAWLVWTRPGGMTWGFFLYVIWFNPGQSYEYYALLQHAPAALIAQNLVASIAQGAGFAGFLLFALRVPQGESSPRWRPLERSLPAIGVALAMLLALSYANVLGYPTEIVTRAGILSGFLVAAGAFAILLTRRSELPALDYQRLRWVIWGCLIGLPALLIADIGQGTTLLGDVFKSVSPGDELWGLVRLVNGVLCLFVFEAVRRPRVVSVAIPLRRVTILGLLLSLPILLLHEQIEHIREEMRHSLTFPSWVWLAIAVLILFLISRLHEFAVHVADRHFNRAVARAGHELGEAILRSPDMTTLEGLLVKGPCQALDLASAVLYREDGGVFRRRPGAEGWGEADTAATLHPGDPLLSGMKALRPFEIGRDAARGADLPQGPARPGLAVPIADRLRAYAVVLYGAHHSGNDLNHDERGMLAKLAELAHSAFAKLDHDGLRQRVAQLERERDALASKLAAHTVEKADRG